MVPSSQRLWLSVFLFGCSLLPLGSGSADILKGVSYAPVPYKKQQATGMFSDDFFSEDARAFWGPEGRGDLAIMQSMGINTVRLYGLDPRFDHASFLDYAKQLGLGVIPGISEYPYKGNFAGSCEKNAYDCYDAIKDSWAQTLTSGILDGNKYHSALTSLIIVNEPDYKLPSFDKPKLWTKAILSALDGMISAEKDANVDTSGDAPSFTVAWAFAICSECSEQKTEPALGQMTELRRAIANPQDYGYSPVNDLKDAYAKRFVNGCNVFNQASDIDKFITKYKAVFPSTKIFFGEYNAPNFAEEKNLKAVVDTANKESALAGFSFFEFQVRYDKGGSEMEFGMLGLGDEALKTVTLYGDNVTVWCVNLPSDPRGDGQTIAGAVAAAFGGDDWGSRKPCGVCGSAGNCISPPAFGGSGHGGLVWALLAVILVLGLALGAFWFYRRRRARTPSLLSAAGQEMS